VCARPLLQSRMDDEGADGRDDWLGSIDSGSASAETARSRAPRASSACSTRATREEDAAENDPAGERAREALPEGLASRAELVARNFELEGEVLRLQQALLERDAALLETREELASTLRISQQRYDQVVAQLSAIQAALAGSTLAKLDAPPEDPLRRTQPLPPPKTLRQVGRTNSELNLRTANRIASLFAEPRPHDL